MQSMQSSNAESTNSSQAYGRCGVVAETPPVVRCGLNPSDDTFVDNFFPDKPFAKALGNPSVPNPILIVQNTTQYHVTYGNLSLNVAYLKFDLAGLVPQELLVSHAEPKNATLWLYVRWVSPFYNASVRVYRALSNDWEERTLTWNTKPAFDKTSYAETSIRADGTWVRWDVSEQVRLAVREGSQISFAVTGSETSWRNVAWFDSNDQRLEGNVSTRPELDLDFVAPILTVQTPYANLPITIGNKTYQTDINGTFQALLAWGSYEISVPEIIPKGDGARASFVGWSDTVHEASRNILIGNSMTLYADYETEYYLNVTSPYGLANGSRWYRQNTEAHASVRPAMVMAEGVTGMLGVRHAFDHWIGDCTGSGTECVAVMDSKKSVTAVWREDYTITILAAVAIVLLAAVALLLVKKRRR
jgi:hypothetical protein